MTPESRRLVQESWRQAVPIVDTMMRLFYYRLFELDPQLGSRISPADLARCRTRLVQALNALVVAMAWGGDEAARSLGPARGGDAGQQEKVAEALLWMLERGLGHRFTLPVRQAWAEAVREHGLELTCAALGEAAGIRVAPIIRRSRGLVPAGS